MVGKYRAYPEYKDSGVEWLGEVPAHWIVRRLKHTSELQSGIPKGKDLSDRMSISVPMLRVANVQDGFLDLNEVHEILIEPDQLDRYLLRSGDVLMNEGGDNDKLGRGAIWHGAIERCIHQNHVFAIRPYSIEPEWLDWLTRAEYAKFHFYRVAKQSTNLASISSTNVKETPLLIPPKGERDAIVEFLDHETAKIDTLIEKQQQLIKLLKEKRQAVISHAVTKGLNPNVPMNDSGVEWLGEVPAHWEVVRIKHVAHLNPSKSEVDRFDASSCSFIPMEKLKTDSLVLDEARLVADVFDGYTYFRDEDILMAKVTPCFENKNIAIARDLINGLGFGSSEIYVIRSNYRICNSFLFFRLQEDGFIEIATAAMTGAGGLRRVPSDVLMNFPFAMPPLEEQKKIAGYLRKFLGKLDGLVAKAQTAILLMQERRTALISAAVTGKIDVRDWQPPGNTESKSNI